MSQCCDDPRLYNGGPVFYVGDLLSPKLSGEDAHHLISARRAKPEEEIIIGDGRGSLRLAKIVRISSKRGEGDVDLSPHGPIYFEEEKTPVTTVASYIPKGDRLSYMVEKLAETGLDQLYLISSSLDRRSGKELGASSISRLYRVAHQASMQAKRARPLRFGGVIDPQRCIEVFGPTAALCDFNGTKPSFAYSTWIVGPESGVVDSEFSVLPKIRLTSQVLRVETASVVSAALLVAFREQLIKEG